MFCSQKIPTTLVTRFLFRAVSPEVASVTLAPFHKEYHHHYESRQKVILRHTNGGDKENLIKVRDRRANALITEMIFTRR
jgi:hypothetical protein